MKQIYTASLFVITLLPGCSQGDNESIKLAEQAQLCVERTAEGNSIAVPVRIALTDDGSVALVEVKGRNADQKYYDAADAVTRAVKKCAPYDVGRNGEFEITLTY